MITPPVKEQGEMKLRVRSTATKETIRVDASDSSSLLDLKTLIVSNLSTPDAPIPPEAVRISLNRSDEIIPSSPGESLRSLGLTSGDLLFYSLRSPFSSTTEEIPNPTPSPVSPLESLAPLSSSPPAILDPTYSTPADGMDVDSEPFVLEKTPSLPCFLRRVMETEKGKIQGSMGLTVVAIHAIFLECGFVSCGGSGGGSFLPEGCTSAGRLVSVMYSLPDLIACGNIEENIKKVSLKFSAVGNHVSIYGCLFGDHPDVYRLCLDSSKLTPLLSSSTNELSETEQAELFQLWKIVKDCLSMPLLIDICQKNGLLLPPCFTRLPTDVKIMILELLPSIDIAKAACANSELRYLASNDELWKGKFLEEFGPLDERNTRGSWKEKFARFWVKRKITRTDRGNALVPYIGTPRIIPVPWVPGTQRFPMIGGDYDRFPAIGDLGSLRRARFPHHPARRNFSPNCNLGGGSFIYSSPMRSSFQKEVSSPMATPCSSANGAEHFSTTDWNALISAEQTVDFDASNYLSPHNARPPLCEGMVEQIMRSPFNNQNFPEMSSPIGLSAGFQIPNALYPADFTLTNKCTERNLKGKKRTISECGGSLPQTTTTKSDEAKEQNYVSPESIKSTLVRDEKKQKSELFPGLCSNKSTFMQTKGIAQVDDDDDSKEVYIHVRAKRGKATNSHSLAERVRREKISERMRVLQDLVPGCNKITGKAVMLDEIINYVQSLQQQVEFLTMKLATVNPELNFDIERIFSKTARDENPAFVGYRQGMNTPYARYHGAGHFPSEMLMTHTTPQLSSMAQMKNVWDEELQNAIQMAFMPRKNLRLNVTDPKIP